MDQGPTFLVHNTFISAPLGIPQMIMLSASCILLSSSSHFLSSKATTFGSFICPLITYVREAVAASVGAVIGFFVGPTNESGAIRGAVIGALSGVLYAAEAFKSSLAMWHSNESKLWDFQHVIGIVSGVLSKRLDMEKFVFALQSAIQNEDFEIGEIVRCLPNCQHKFHMPCIDAWIIKHGSCPLCRRHFANPISLAVKRT